VGRLGPVVDGRHGPRGRRPRADLPRYVPPVRRPAARVAAAGLAGARPRGAVADDRQADLDRGRGGDRPWPGRRWPRQLDLDAPVAVYAAEVPQELDDAILAVAARTPQAPPRVMVNNDVNVDVPVTITRPATKAVVSLKRGNEVVASQEIHFPAGPAEQAKTV